MNVAVGSRFETTTGAVTTSPSPSSTPRTAPPSTTMRDTLVWRRSSPPWRSNSDSRWSAMVPRPPRTLDMVAVPGDASAKARHSALPGEYGPR